MHYINSGIILRLRRFESFHSELGYSTPTNQSKRQRRTHVLLLTKLLIQVLFTLVTFVQFNKFKRHYKFKHKETKGKYLILKGTISSFLLDKFKVEIMDRRCDKLRVYMA